MASGRLSAAEMGKDKSNGASKEVKEVLVISKHSIKAGEEHRLHWWLHRTGVARQTRSC